MSDTSGRSSKKNNGQTPGKSTDAKSSPIKNNIIPILIFLAAIFFLITFSNPALFLNDEWVTANQLHQLDIGHQVVTNEGKYGVYSNGTPAAYFQTHNNNLGYTLMLPVLSLPMLKVFGIFGDAFRFPVLLLWTIIPVIMALLVELYAPKYSRFYGIKLTWIALPLMFILFLYNLLNFTIFPFSASDAPGEVAAIIFTQYLLFGILCIIIYKICEIFFSDKRYSLFGTLTIICCSSYLFWAGNAKDHLLIALIFSLVLLFMLRFIRSGKYTDALLAFLFVGLMAWGRPEVAFSILVCTLAFYVVYLVWEYLKTKNTAPLKLLLVPLITPIGALPYFLNNLYVMGNLFTPSASAFSASSLNTSISAVPVSSASPTTSNGYSAISSILGTIMNYYAMGNWAEMPSDFLGVLFKPASGSIGLFVVASLLALTLLFLLYTYRRSDEKSRLSIYFLLVVLAGCIFAYLPVVHILNTEPGISPDMRYLSTAYLPIGILGLFVINSLISTDGKKVLAGSLPKYLLVLTPILLIALILVHPMGVSREDNVSALALITYAVMILTIICAALKVYGKIGEKPLLILLMILIALPFAWQMFNLFILSDGKFNGYSYWIPMIQNIHHAIFSINT